MDHQQLANTNKRRRLVTDLMSRLDDVKESMSTEDYLALSTGLVSLRATDEDDEKTRYEMWQLDILVSRTTRKDVSRVGKPKQPR